MSDGSGEKEPVPVAIDCPVCDRPVIAEPVGFTYFQEDRGGIPERWTLLRCPEWHPMLVVQNLYAGIESFNEDPPYRVHPPQDRHLSRDIPQTLRDAHEEARKCFNTKAYAATVIMCGRTVEGACKLHGVTQGMLGAKLKEMKKRGLIDGRLADWADILRGVRNAAAHADDDKISRQDAEDSIAFSEALLDYLYVLSARFDAMKARRQP